MGARARSRLGGHAGWVERPAMSVESRDRLVGRGVRLGGLAQWWVGAGARWWQAGWVAALRCGRAIGPGKEAV